MVVYSPGEGPVPFTYSAEAFPLYIRDIGMSFATATTWGEYKDVAVVSWTRTSLNLPFLMIGFNFVLSLTWPPLERGFTSTGAFSWYAAWNLFGWVYCYFLLPETKNLTLEELDVVFNVGNREHFKYYAEKAPWYVNCLIEQFQSG